jgi:hypothetical protein
MVSVSPMPALDGRTQKLFSKNWQQQLQNDESCLERKPMEFRKSNPLLHGVREKFLRYLFEITYFLLRILW